MKLPLPAPVRCLLVALALMNSASAQVVPTPTPPTLPPPTPPLNPNPPATLPTVPRTDVTEVNPTPFAGRTTLALEMVPADAASMAGAHITAPLDDKVVLTVPDAAGLPVEWFKGGTRVPGATSHVFTIPRISPSDAGAYQLITVPPLGQSRRSQVVTVAVGPLTRCINLSTRGLVAAGAGQALTAGFVVGGGWGGGKLLVVRAIGPSLAAFGVAAPLRAPVVRIFDSNGFERTYPHYRALLTSEGKNPDAELAATLAKVGLFPIPAGTLDVVYALPFGPGAYTAQVTSADHTGGEVLLEIYEVP